MIYIPGQILFGLNQEGWDGRRMWHEWEFWWKTLRERDHLKAYV